jgi:hypothetical protein
MPRYDLSCDGVLAGMTSERIIVAQIDGDWAVVVHGIVVRRVPTVSQALRLAVETAWDHTHRRAKVEVVVQRYGQDSYSAWDSDRDAYSGIVG